MQTFQFADEENKDIRISFLSFSLMKLRIYLILSILTLGLIPIFFHWFKNLKIMLYNKETFLENATHVILAHLHKNKSTIKKLSNKQSTLLPHYPSKGLFSFNYKKHFYYFSIQKSKIKSLKGKMLNKLKKNPELLKIYKKGNSDRTARQLISIYTQNLIEIKVDSIFNCLLKQIFSPFSMFQIVSIIIWLCDNYLSYALLIVIMMVMSISMDIYAIRSEAFKIRELAHHEVPVSLTRNSPSNRKPSTQECKVIIEQKQTNYKIEPENLSGSEEPLLNATPQNSLSVAKNRVVSSFDICVGDIIDIKSNEVVPADVLLIQGKCLIDESNLTGETVPVVKTPLDETDLISEGNILSAGTLCLNTFNAKGIVIATGYYSKKGELVRSLLLADPIEFRFQKDSLKFILITIIVSFVGFIWFVFSIALGKYAEYYTTSVLVIKGLEIFTVAVPPALPLCLAIGNAIANARLKKQNIFTRVLQKINEAGRVACACFDKTGTLTMNKLILFGILPIYDGQAEIGEKGSLPEDEIDEEGGKFLVFDNLITMQLNEVYNKHCMNKRSIYRVLIESLGLCHGLSMFKNYPIGDPMEVQLFEESEFTMTENLVTDELTGITTLETFISPSLDFLNSCDYPNDFMFHILRRIDFSSDRKRMSVIMENNKDENTTILTKGAPEILKALCDPTSLPFNFDEVLEEYTEQGLRVIAVAFKRIASVSDALSLSPVQLENNLEFIGFLLFQNPLKENTASTIATLKSCKISCKMITGDNLLTATSVGIATGIVNKSAALFAAHAENGLIWWEQLENEDEKQNKHTSIFSQDHSGIYLSRKSSESYSSNDSIDEEEQGAQRRLIQAYCDRKTCSIVMSGDAFDILYARNWEKDKFLNSVLESAVVFARTSPEQKAQIVEKIQKWYKIRSSDNWFVAFCGDGANDCSALKKADVGLSLSETEASIAAPFNTTVQDISSMIPLLREGKASLETAFMNFKYILYYSFCQFFALLAVYSHAGEFANGHYYYMDMIVFLPLSIFICSNGTIGELNKHFPKSSLMKPEVLFEIFGHIFLVGIAYVIMNHFICIYPEYLGLNSIIRDHEIDAELQFNVDIFGFFILATILYSVGALVFNRGYPFKVHPLKNLPLVIYSCLTLCFTVLILFADSITNNVHVLYLINTVFRELKIDINLVLLFASFAVGVSLACLIFEKMILPLFKEFCKKKQAGGQRKKGKS